MMSKKILVVDDEADIVELCSYNLRKEGYDVASAPDGEAALGKIREDNFDLVLLDLMLPGLQGVELCRIIRNDPATASLPIIMLTAKTEELDKVLGLEMGADDYVTKPFSPRELLARVRAVLRRSGAKAERAAPKEKETVIRLGALVIDLSAYTVIKDGKPLDLSSTEFRLLSHLVENKGKVYNREQLLNTVWKDGGYVEPRTVDVHIRRLRTQIEDDPANPLYIKTKRGIGYYANADV
ncbi:MAG: response regulator [Candidatus Sulfobium sp.]